jgi:hypothetical protein
LTSNSDAGESKIEKTSEQFVDMYLNSPDIRNPVLQIPVLGPVIDFVIITLSRDLEKKRLLRTFQIIHEEIIRINENMVDFSYIEGEEFHDNMRRLFEYSIRTRHEEKIRWYCRILIGSALLENVKERGSAEDFLIFLSELTTTDILVGKEIYERQKNVSERYGFDISSKDNTELKYVVEEGKWHEIKDKLGLDEVNFNISLIKLSRVGLIKEIVGPYVGYAGWLYLITPAFIRLMKLIKYANEPTFNYKIR